MKRLTITATLLLMVVMPMIAGRVSPETARKVATTFLKNNGAKSTELTDLSKAAGFPNLYIFNAKPGFVVMAADNCVKPILGYSLTGTFVVDNMPENVRDWLQGYSDDIQYAIDNRMRASAEDSQLWNALAAGKGDVAKTTVVVEPLIQTKWDQGKYYNDSCPLVTNSAIDNGRAYTGCVATAMAQIMKYYDYPKNPNHGIGSHYYKWSNDTLRADFNSANYDWDFMDNYYDHYYDDDGTLQTVGTPSPESVSAVATLMYHCGVSVNMFYSGRNSPGSTATTSDVVFALREYFNYSPDMVYKSKDAYPENTDRDGSEWENMVKGELNEERPLQYKGRGSRGHSFVCDGYDSNNNFHFNWGWSGLNDGYFTLSTMNGYSNDQGAVFGIIPVDCSAPAPAKLSYTLSDQQINLSWMGSTASSYKVYRNGIYVGSSSSTTYSEEAHFGTSVYYVRAVDVQGRLSLSSNNIVVYVDYPQPVVDDVEVSYNRASASFTWTTPDWCYPETPMSMLTYGNGTYGGKYTAGMWAHRFIAQDIAQYSDKSVYKVAFYAILEGVHRCYVYEGTLTSGGDTYYTPETLLSEKEVSVSNIEKNSWIVVDLDSIALINGQQDLWVVIHYPYHSNFSYPAAYTYETGYEHGKYNLRSGGGSGENIQFVKNSMDWSYLIRTYVTDGIYTYNIYDGETKLNDEPISDTTYTFDLDDLANNTIHNYTIKTNYYKGESDASNMVSFAVGNASLASLEMAANNKMIVINGSTLNVAGTVTNTNPNNLVIEDGAQLIHNSVGVMATVKKNIASRNNGNGWNFIASPVVENISPSEGNGLLRGDYDLYYYDEPAHYWRNYKSHINDFTIERSKGYLYANGSTDGSVLRFAGTLTPSNNTITIRNLSHEGALLNGFNLVGNPFACNATINTDYYVISEDNIVVLAEVSGEVAPCEGVFVKTTDASDYSVEFTRAGNIRRSNSGDCMDLVVTQGRSTLDRVRVRFGEGTNMEKFTLEDNHTQLALWQDGQEYAVAYADGMGEMPMNFKAANNGTYTLSIETDGLDLDYLHLIDLLTGVDVDLLPLNDGNRGDSKPVSYTFEAKNTDFASRFKIVFSVANGSPTDSSAFAFFSNGNIIVNGEGTLQVLDVMGRVILCRDAMHCVSTSEMPAGVYVLRLVDGNSVKTQKIVIP